MSNILFLLFGTLFGAGLALSGMTDPERVLGFLDLFGVWDPTLAFVMLAALIVGVPAFNWQTGKKPLFSDVRHEPIASAVDKKLTIGAMIFGVGWGLTGLCPGPAVASLAYGQLESWLFLLAMALGMFSAERLA